MRVIAARVSTVALATCGVRTTFGRPISAFGTSGSFANTSSPALIRPETSPSPSTIRRRAARMSARVRSAVAASSTPGVFVTAMPRARQAPTSIWSKPTPKLATSRRAGYRSSTGSSTLSFATTSTSTSSRCRSGVPTSTSRSSFHASPGKRLVASTRTLPSLTPSQRQYLVQPARVEHVGGGRPPAPGCGDGESHVVEPANRVRVRRADDGHAGFDGETHLLVPQVEPVRQPVRLERDALGERDLEHALQHQRVGRPVVDDPSLRVAEAAHGGMAHRLDDLLRQPVCVLSLSRVERELHPLELRERVVGEIERSVAPDVALGAAQDAERCKRGVHRVDLLRLTAQRAGVETRHDADVRRVVADREVLVAAATCRHGHLLDRRLAVRPRRVTVQVASDLAGLDERWRLALERALPQLRRAPW